MSLLAPRRLTKPVYVGDVRIGGGAPIVVQSMATADTRDPRRSVEACLDSRRVIKCSIAGRIANCRRFGEF